MTLNLSDVIDITLNGSSVVKIEDSLGTVLWEKTNPEPLTETYFYVENLTNRANTLTLAKGDPSTDITQAPSVNVYRSTDKITWTSMGSTSGYSPLTYSIPANSKVYLKATTQSWGSSSYYNKITCSGNFAVGGNVMSLLYGDNYIDKKVFPDSEFFSYNFDHLFYNSTTLKSISNLNLPATTLTDHCYSSMFEGCTGLTSIPSDLLPATTLAEYCYNWMFRGCTGITSSIPSTLLPATTLTNYCYWGMFKDCTGLTSIPSNLLPATTLAGDCYMSMFSGCTGLTSIPSTLLHSTTTLTNYCYYGMFSDCTGLTTIPSNLLPATTLMIYCYGSMFNGCTGLTSIPSNLLPATTMILDCYWGMFRDCTGLTSIPSTLLHSTSLADHCYSNMFEGCTGLTNIPSDLLPATTMAKECYYRMFYGCTGITKAPKLPATTLVEKCYQQMFHGCSSLNEIICYANDISATNCTYSWVSGVAASGTFYKQGSANWTLDSVNGIPTGWTVDTNEYFYVENLTNSANTLSIKKKQSSSPTITVYRSTDKTNWTPMGSTSTTALTYSIPANSKVYLKATANNWSFASSSKYNSITCSGNFAVGGNIMSLLYGDDYIIGQTVFPTSSAYNFSCLFFRSTNLKNIDNLVLPATTLTSKCYWCMFNGCTGLTSIPSDLLPSTTLADDCYSNMFYGCTGITTIPSNLLPATTLVYNCYSSMFSGCTGLTTIPSNLLPATTLALSCYNSMFYGCTGLTSIPSNLLPATTLDEECYIYMFCDCTGLTKAPELPATTLAEGCYEEMFNGCSSLNEITCYANDISASNCTYQWVSGVAAYGTFYKKGSANWTTGKNGIPTGWTTEYPDNTYFYVQNLTNSANTLTIKKSSSSQSQVLVYYSTDQTTWTSMGYTTINGITYSIPANSKVYLKANTTKWGQTQYGYTCISAADDFSIGGNIMSLLYGDNFRGQTTIPTPTDSDGGPAAFYGLFHGALKLKSINNLVLPATTLTKYCYHMMFDRCKGLTSIPSNLLPATTLTHGCYDSMFSFCTGLTSIPSTLLHSTTLASSCYNGMFSGCSGLTSIPSNLLPATTLATDCYTFMFDNCTGLTNIPSTLLHSTTLASHCYYGMFRSCTGLTTIPSNLLPATTLYEYCYNSMFYGCTGLTSSPILPATTLAQACYAGMFYNCSSLNKVICYANHISATDCTSQWLSGVSRYGTFYKLGSADWGVGDSGIPLYWTTETNL